MLNATLLSALNTQMNREMASAYLYLAMSAYFESQALNGFAHWFSTQAQEEVKHAMKFFHYIIDRGSLVNLPAIESVPVDWQSPLAIAKAAYAHEQKVSAWILELRALAQKLNDPTTEVFLNWYVTEQIEEEAQTSELVMNLERMGENAGALSALDHALGKRA